MWYWALGFLLVALITGFLTFGAAALALSILARFIFYVAVVMFVVSLIGVMMRPV